MLILSKRLDAVYGRAQSVARDVLLLAALTLMATPTTASFSFSLSERPVVYPSLASYQTSATAEKEQSVGETRRRAETDEEQRGGLDDELRATLRELDELLLREQELAEKNREAAESSSSDGGGAEGGEEDSGASAADDREGEDSAGTPAGGERTQTTTGRAPPPPDVGDVGETRRGTETDEEKRAGLDDELRATLRELDELLLREQELVEESREAAESSSSDSGGAEGGGEDSGASADDDREGEDSAGAQVAGGTARGLPDAPPGAPLPPLPTTTGTPAGGATTGRAPRPPDVGDGRDDDIVARQLREAAQNEKDPALREKLWDEYRAYKHGAKRQQVTKQSLNDDK